MGYETKQFTVATDEAQVEIAADALSAALHSDVYLTGEQELTAAEAMVDFLHGAGWALVRR